MHELRIAEDLAKTVFEIAASNRLTKVTKLNLAFGQMVQIQPDIFESGFRMLVKGTVASGAELEIEILTVKIKCNSCGAELMVPERNFFCSKCRSTDLEIIQGKELFIKSIEGE